MNNFLSELENLSIDLEIDLSILESKILDLEKKSENFSDEEIFSELSNMCQNKGYIHPHWNMLAGRIKIKFYKSTSIPSSFSEATKALKKCLKSDYYDFVIRNSASLNEMICDEMDYNFDIFQFETLKRSYLLFINSLDCNGKILIESPSYMYLRVSTFLYYENNSDNIDEVLSKIRKVFMNLIDRKYSHASPTLFNSGLINHQLASCFTMTVDDSLLGLTKSWRDVAMCSKYNGGLGVDMSNIRHSEIGDTGGESEGLIPWLQIQDKILKAVNQGGKRKGSGTFYIPCWHIDVEEFIELRKNIGSEEMRVRQIFLALWISDEFMRRVKNDEMWTLFCPAKAPGLNDRWGLDFEMKYREYEEKVKDGKITRYRKVRARDIMTKIIKTQCTTGMPFILFKDAVNRKTNHMNSGTIRTSNLCVEIVQFVSKDQSSVCILGSMCIPSYIKTDENNNQYFDYNELVEKTGEMVVNLNQLIDRNKYIDSVPELEHSAKLQRSIAIGMVGLADAIAKMDMIWKSDEARDFNRKISEAIYYGAVKSSVKLSKKYGPYRLFEGSPASKGMFQFDLWNKERFEKECSESQNASEFLNSLVNFSSDFQNTSLDLDWESLRQKMMKYGLRNSLLTGYMPTASSANILGMNECFEPFTEPIYSRTVLSGQFMMINKYMVEDLMAIDMWNTDTLKKIWTDKSLKNIESDEHSERVEHIKEKYKTVYELPQKLLLEYALDRGPYTDQSQSLNCWYDNPEPSKILSFLMYGWENGIKTGMYYLRRNQLREPINYSLDVLEIPSKKKIVCNEDICVSCSG